MTVTRDHDIYLLGVSETTRIPLQLGVDARIAYGPAAAAQKFIVRLLTRRGSVVGSPEQGSEFLAQVFSGGVRNSIDLTNVFYSAAQLTIIQLIEENPNADEDEQIVAASVQSASVVGNEAQISAILTTESGVGVSVDLPIRLSALPH